MPEMKTEADSNDVTEHPRDDKPGPYLCTVCDKRFKHRHRLNQHKRTHTGEKPFVCRMCNKGFTLKEQLNVHMVRHTGAEGSSYSCSQCEKRFSSQSSLRQHMNIHRSKYKCKECGKCCGTSSELAKHNGEVIQERNRLNVMFVANDLQHQVTLWATAEFTVEKNRLNVMFVANDLQHQVTLLYTAEFTVERNRLNVTCVTRRLVSLHFCTVT